MKAWCTILGVLAAAGGCDKLADENSQGPALATMRGTLLLADGMEPPKGDLYISILWQAPSPAEPVDAECGRDGIAGLMAATPAFEQRLDIDTSFPAAFSVALTEPPPAEALVPFDDGGKTTDVETATGYLVVYRDVNGNGRLDLRGIDGKASPDEVLGTSEGTKPLGANQDSFYKLMYLTGDLANGSFTDIVSKAGYSLVVQGWDDVMRESTFEARDLSDQDIELVLHESSYAQKWTCRERCRVRDDSRCPADPNDLPNVPELGDEARSDVYQWVLEDGDDEETAWYAAACYRGFPKGQGAPRMYEVHILQQDGCTLTFSECEYRSAELPEGVDLPCTEYLEDVLF